MDKLCIGIIIVLLIILAFKIEVIKMEWLPDGVRGVVYKMGLAPKTYIAVVPGGSVPVNGKPIDATSATKTGDGGKGAVEKLAMAENAQYYGSCYDPTVSNKDEECGGKLNFAQNDFGIRGATYNDYIASQGVDPGVIKSNAEFVASRYNTQTQNIIGRTYSPDSHDSYDPVPWVGIRGRPRAVPMCNPTQVPDMDISLFAQEDKLRWTGV